MKVAEAFVSHGVLLLKMLSAHVWQRKVAEAARNGCKFLVVYAEVILHFY